MITDPWRTHLLLLKLLPSDQSQKLLDELAVLHYGLHVGRLTIGEYLVAHSIDWTIPGGQSSSRIVLVALLALCSGEGKTHFGPFEKVPSLTWREFVSTAVAM